MHYALRCTYYALRITNYALVQRLYSMAVALDNMELESIAEEPCVYSEARRTRTHQFDSECCF